MLKSLRRILPHKSAHARVPFPNKDSAGQHRECSQRLLLDGRVLRVDEAEHLAEPKSVNEDGTVGDGIEGRLLTAVTDCLATVRGEKRPQQDVRQNASKPAAVKRPHAPSIVASTTESSTATAATPRLETAKVQLRLSKASVRVLTAFSKMGRHPSAIVERALWRDPAVQDAAAILRIERKGTSSN